MSTNLLKSKSIDSGIFSILAVMSENYTSASGTICKTRKTQAKEVLSQEGINDDLSNVSIVLFID